MDEKQDREDRLRVLLEERASHARVSPNAWEKIVTRRRSRRRIRYAVTGFASVLVIAIVAFGLTRLPRPSTDVATQPTASPSIPSSPSPTSDSRTGFEDSAFWPTSDFEEAARIQADADAGNDTWRKSAASVAAEFSRKYIGWQLMSEPDDSVEFSDGALQRATVSVIPNIAEEGRRAGVVHEVSLVAFPAIRSPVWFISGIAPVENGDVLSLTAPRVLDTVSSPILIRGHGRGFEGTLNVRVLDDAGGVLHPRAGRDEGYVMAGTYSAEPFESQIEFSPPSSARGVLVITSSTGLDASPPEWIIRRIRFG